MIKRNKSIDELTPGLQSSNECNLPMHPLDPLLDETPLKTTNLPKRIPIASDLEDLLLIQFHSITLQNHRFRSSEVESRTLQLLQRIQIYSTAICI